MAKIANPCQGDMDHGDGDRKKMIFKMLKGLEDEDGFDLRSMNISDFMHQVEEAAHTFFLTLRS